MQHMLDSGGALTALGPHEIDSFLTDAAPYVIVALLAVTVRIALPMVKVPLMYLNV